MDGRIGRLVWICAFVALIVLECVPVWTLQYFPSQDGPSHVYNAVLLANWSSQPLYRQYYEIHVTPAGNLLFQVFLAGMIKILSPALIERALLTIYIVVFALAFLVLLRDVSTQAKAFALFGFVLVANSFFHTGFWNFIFSIPLTILALRYYYRSRERATSIGFLLMLSLWGIGVYEMHMASWMVMAMSIGIFSVGELLKLYPRRSEMPVGTFGGMVVRALAPLSTQLPPLVLTLMFVASTGFRSVSAEVHPETLLDRVKPLCTLSFFRSLSNMDLGFAAVFGILVVAMTAAAVWKRLRTERVFQAADVWLLLAISCAAGSVLAPSSMSAVFIRHRLAFYAWIFLVVWLSTQSWRPSVLRWCSASACLLAVFPFFWRIPEYRRWERTIAEFATVGPSIRPGSTVLALDMERQQHRINPLLHVVDVFAPKPFVDLRNYEAAMGYFPTQFQPRRSPFDSLGTLDQLELKPPVFHLAQYEEQQHSSVDYLLFYGPKGDTLPEGKFYSDQLRDYQLVYVSKPEGVARLYQRVSLTSGARIGGD